ncbi:ferredoxin [Amycolatopsis pithecellobii]|uniref:Ferredoxin n=1 Tax=Amycolatopsis pithecellobii TaxID=664692 RepID=A0A6N7ZCJ2_9PSEU|nr:(4Fe-4S)-binding protein [Amycolatopsis pithecellobii]MTD59337.1 ferredoxin [Amycolatopsis pithecellobii]
MRIVADKDVCVGAGQCVLTDPATFDQSEDDGVVILLNEQPADEQKAREAVQICPSMALTIEE